MAQVGILALQGGYEAHYKSLTRIGAEPFYVRTVEELESCEALVLPGGESTAMLKLLKRFKLFDVLKQRLTDGLPCFATCAGLILAAEQVDDTVQDSLGCLNVRVKRNAYGSQVASFETVLHGKEGSALEGTEFPGVFIRAPKITCADSNVEILAEYENDPVLVRSGAVIAASFHPELTHSDDLHRFFLSSNHLLIRM